MPAEPGEQLGDEPVGVLLAGLGQIVLVAPPAPPGGPVQRGQLALACGVVRVGVQHAANPPDRAGVEAEEHLGGLRAGPLGEHVDDDVGWQAKAERVQE